MTPLAHIAGMPVEETVAGLVPFAAAMFGIAAAHVSRQAHRLRARRQPSAPAARGTTSTGIAAARTRAPDTLPSSARRHGP